MNVHPETSDRPVAPPWRACALLEAAGTLPLRAPDAVALLAYRARLEVGREGFEKPAAGSKQPGHIWPSDRSEPAPLGHHATCEPGPGAAAMLQLLSFGHTVR